MRFSLKQKENRKYRKCKYKEEKKYFTESKSSNEVKNQIRNKREKILDKYKREEQQKNKTTEKQNKRRTFQRKNERKFFEKKCK